MDKLDYIASIPARSEIRSWERKCATLDKLLCDLAPMDEQILAIVAERQPLIDQIETLRHQMTQECIHPREHLLEMQDYVICKFCDRRLVLTDVST